MLTVHARFATVEGKGVGRWRKYYEAWDEQDARRQIRSLVPKCQVRVMNGREVVLGPCRAEELAS